MSVNKNNQKIEKLTKGLIGLLAYNILLPYNVTSYGAGVVVDPSALEAHRATIGKTANGLDQIDIVAPNNNGLSHNKFQEFNVDKRGMILNNSAEMTLTRLAGLVYGNNNLTKGNEAKTILSEVTGIKRSEIEGFIEVAGKETEFILANPNGIYLSSGGFLNMSKTTLTTGNSQINSDGSLGFRIKDGIVEIAKGATINIEDVDYFEILSRAAKIGGVLSSSRTENRSTKELKILTGDNTYNYDTGKYTSEDSEGKYGYAIDATEFGAVSAGKISLISTDKGVGVNSFSSMIATVGNLDIDSKGDIKVKNVVTRKGDIVMKSSEGNVKQ
ncbi:MAG: filamentous hemagglutinin N-terminal domain-containing protein, partial [Psychrilyobacter sp.]|uniref:filamentous hemagglutinin N-terminal domain-containing protein n=1 Tax=Psychrilyobacter sp. TaxID=2586924 RepID=UPI003C775CFE